MGVGEAGGGEMTSPHSEQYSVAQLLHHNPVCANVMNKVHPNSQVTFWASMRLGEGQGPFQATGKWEQIVATRLWACPNSLG